MRPDRATNAARAPLLGAGSLWAWYAAQVTGWNGETDDGWRRQVPALRMGCQDIVELRRGDHRGAKLKLEQDRLRETRGKTKEEVIEYFKQWAGNENVRAAHGDSLDLAPVTRARDEAGRVWKTICVWRGNLPPGSDQYLKRATIQRGPSSPLSVARRFRMKLAARAISLVWSPALNSTNVR